MHKASQTNVNDREYWDEIYKHEELVDKVRVDELRMVALNRWVRIREGELQRAARILDVGCGFGEALTKLHEYRPRDLAGVDISEFAIERNKKVFGPDGRNLPAEWYTADALELIKIWPEPAFDIVWCGETLEHLDDPRDALIQMGRVCHPGGFVIFSTPFKQRNQSHEHVWEFGPIDIYGMSLAIGEIVFFDCCVLPSWLTMFTVIRVGGAT